MWGEGHGKLTTKSEWNHVGQIPFPIARFYAGTLAIMPRCSLPNGIIYAVGLRGGFRMIAAITWQHYRKTPPFRKGGLGGFR